MYQVNFQRVEEKYMVTKKQKDELLKRMSDYIEKDKYFISNIYNIYFDTENSDIIAYSISKPAFKDKFRIRSYGLPKLEDDIFLEIKVKYKGVVGKRRTTMKLKDFYKMIDTNNFEDNNKELSNDQILNEFKYYYKYYKLRPAIFVAYDRESYKGIQDEGLRITFDKNLRSRRENLKLENDEKNLKFFKEEKYLVEIKTLNSLPLWLTRILSDLDIMPISFSKYGKIYESEIYNLRKGEKVC